MWNEIRSEQDIRDFMDKVYAFHDSCIKEMHYVSGASVDADLIEDYDGTIICAARLRWRAIDGHMGNGEFYKSVYLE